MMLHIVQIFPPIIDVKKFMLLHNLTHTVSSDLQLASNVISAAGADI